MGGDGLGERHRLVAERIVAGLTPLETATSLGVAPRTMAATVEDLQRSLGVLTLRALSFRLMAQGLVPLPPPLPQPKLDPMTRHVWAALPWDILDIDLTPVLATAIRVAPDHIRSVIDRLCETHATSRHGLIRAGIAHGVLGVGQGVTPPPTSAVLASPPGTGDWDPSPAQRRVLALLASGRDAPACARAEATTLGTIAWRTTRCKELAGVSTGRALIHQALRAGVLLPPEVCGDLAPVGMERSVWQCLPLDVAGARLPSVIGILTGLSVNTVHGYLRTLRTRYRTYEAAVYAGWKLGVITARTSILPPDRQPPPPPPPPTRPSPSAPADTLPAVEAPMRLSGRQHAVLSLLTVDGMSLARAAAHLDVRSAAVRANERSCLRRAEVATLRALTDRSLRMGLLAPLDAGDRDPGAVPADAEAVWQCLPVDVADSKLVARITRMTGLGEDRVLECLELLRATGLTDPQLIAVGWHRKLLPITRTAPGRLITQPRPISVGSLDSPRIDPLFLLPCTPPAPGDGIPPWAASALAGEEALAGHELDFIRMSPSTCRSFLTWIPVTRWGPVIGLPEARAALLVTKAEPRPARRGQAARLVRPGAGITLPGPETRTGPGSYWAVGPAVPLWEQADLAWLLEHSTQPMPDVTCQGAR
ncbi:hypothetical protein OG728_38790 (plasmid) [Streptomyces microflavus]|uniref:hypothetical protein n=1 Tax=Streptomyces microflavus TaxID=1919 RepID=UPI002E0E03AB|nr:hypothetical protein OG728_38790 [Streptomyces microflavus]